ncbi:MAG: helix-turn-helix domain-containing protein [Microlunatus sp.]|nr:helix-turn-helix domain-containing protein [Microlunatus sp.]
MAEIPEWTFGDRVRKARRDMGWSQSDLADHLTARLGHPLSAKTVGAWEIAQHRPADVVDIARALEAITEIPATWFLGLD